MSATSLPGRHDAIRERLETLSSLLPGVVYLWRQDRDGTFSVPYAGGDVVAMFELDPDDLVEDASRIVAMVHPHDVEAYLASIERSRRDLSTWSHEYRIVRSDGGIRWLAGQALPERQDDGATVWTGFIADVTEQRAIHDRLAHHEATLRQVTDTLQDIVVMTDGGGRMEFVTPSVRSVLGLEPDAVSGRPVTELFLPGDRAAIGELLRRGADEPLEACGAHAHGHEVWLEVTGRRLTDGDGTVLSCRDVTQRIRDRRALQREVAYRRTLVELTSDMLSAELDERFYQQLMERAIELVPDAEGGSMVLWDDEAERYRFVAAQGFDLDVLRTIQLTPSELGRSDPPRVERIQVHEDGKRLPPEKLQRFRDAGRLQDIRMTLSVPITARGRARGFLNLDNFRLGDAFGPVAIEVAEALAVQVGLAFQRLQLEASLRQERARYRHLAGHDPLTDLPNRRLFQDRLEQALRRAERGRSHVGLIYVDLDDFKGVNDRFGHAVGDALLQAVAVRLTDTVRGEDSVARLGGDEFAVVLAGIADEGDATTVAEKLRTALARPFRIEGVDISICASVGYAVHSVDGDDPDTLMRAADGAMYRCKGRGRPADAD